MRSSQESNQQIEQVNMEEILCGNGAAELFLRQLQAVCPQKALVIAPSFSEYEEALRSVGAEVEYYYLCEEDNFQILEDYVDKLSEEIDMIFLCNPNNPTGVIYSGDTLDQLQKARGAGRGRVLGIRCMLFRMNHTESLFMMITSCRLCRLMSKTV